MTVVPANRADIPALLDLWMEAFGEEKEAVLPFFREIFPLCRPFCVKDGETLCAMAYALPQTMRTSDGDLPMAYFYAVATKKEYRGRGLASLLLEEMAAALQKEGFAGILLVPANPPLFDFYKKVGFVPFSYRKKQRFCAETWNVSPITPQEYLALREAYLPQTHNVPPEQVLRHFHLFAWEGGCAAAEQTESGLVLREALGDERGIGGVLTVMGCGLATVHLPQGDEPYAVCRPLTEQFPKEGYFAFAME